MHSVAAAITRRVPVRIKSRVLKYAFGDKFKMVFRGGTGDRREGKKRSVAPNGVPVLLSGSMKPFYWAASIAR